MHNDPKAKLAGSARWADIAAVAILIGIFLHIYLDSSSTMTLKFVDGAVAAATLAQLILARRARQASDELQRITDAKVAESNVKAAEGNRIATESELKLERYR